MLRLAQRRRCPGTAGSPAARCSFLALAILPGAGHGQTPPDPVRCVLEEALVALTTDASPVPPAPVLVAARRALREGSPAERGQAALLLGYCRLRDDRSLLLQALDDEPDVASRALVGLGLLGGAANTGYLGQILADRRADEQWRALAALALGLTAASDPNDSSSTGELKRHVAYLVGLSRSKHAAELAACFAGMPPGEGRTMLLDFLRRSSIGFSDGGYDAEPSLQAAALGALASRVATDDEWVTVRTGLGSDGYGPRRFQVAWGLWRHTGRGLDEKLSLKIARELGRRLDDPDPAVAGMAFLALRNFDADGARQRARDLLRPRPRRHALLAVALLHLGALGERSDEAILQAYERQPLGDGELGAWCLACAELARRLAPDAWPWTKDPALGEPPFPLLALRRRLVATPPAGVLAEAGCAVALARLEDRSSLVPLRARFYDTPVESVRRSLALVLLRLDPRALDDDGEEPALRPEHRIYRNLAWAWAGQPQVWTTVTEGLAEERTAAERADALHLAVLAMARPSRDLSIFLRHRLGPGLLPPPLDQIPRW